MVDAGWKQLQCSRVITISYYLFSTGYPTYKYVWHLRSNCSTIMAVSPRYDSNGRAAQIYALFATNMTSKIFKWLRIMIYNQTGVACTPFDFLKTTRSNRAGRWPPTDWPWSTSSSLNCQLCLYWILSSSDENCQLCKVSTWKESSPILSLVGSNQCNYLPWQAHRLLNHYDSADSRRIVDQRIPASLQTLWRQSGYMM